MLAGGRACCGGGSVLGEGRACWGNPSSQNLLSDSAAHGTWDTLPLLPRASPCGLPEPSPAQVSRSQSREVRRGLPAALGFEALELGWGGSLSLVCWDLKA